MAPRPGGAPQARAAGNGDPLASPTTSPGAICRATRSSGPAFARCCVIRRSSGMTKLLSSCLASRKNRLRRGRGRNGSRPSGRPLKPLRLWLPASLYPRFHAVVRCHCCVKNRLERQPGLGAPPKCSRKAERDSDRFHLFLRGRHRYGTGGLAHVIQRPASAPRLPPARWSCRNDAGG